MPYPILYSTCSFAASTLELMNCFEDYIARHHSQQHAVDPRAGGMGRRRGRGGGEKEGSEDDFERELFRDFLLMRSRYAHRVCTVKLSVLSFIQTHIRTLVPFQHYSHQHVRLGNYHYSLENLDRRVTVRLDAFHTDWNETVSKCGLCMHHHAYADEIDGKKQKDVFGVGISSSNPGSGFSGFRRLSTRECLLLYTAITVNPSVRQILRTSTGDAAWKEMEDSLHQLRVASQRHGQMAIAHQYEGALHTLSQIKMLKRSVSSSNIKKIFIGDDARVPVRVEVVDPLLLFERISALQRKSLAQKRSAGQRSRILQLTCDDLSGALTQIKDSHEDLREHFNSVCKERSDHQHLRVFVKTEVYNNHPPTNSYLNQLAHRLRKYQGVRVRKERGQIKKFTYELLVRENVLRRQPFDPLLNSRCCSCWFSCVFCCCPCFSTSLCAGDTSHEKMLFLQRVGFTFSSTDEPDLIQMKIVYWSPEGDNEFLLHSASLSIKDLNDTLEEDLRISYDPTGDSVDIRDTVTFVLRKQKLEQLLSRMHRPRHNESQITHAGVENVFLVENIQ